MSQVISYQRFWMRRGTEAEWAAANPVLHAGEIGVAQDPGASPTVITKFKMGDGMRAWSQLPWCGVGAFEDPGYHAVLCWDTALNNYVLKHVLPASLGGTGFGNFNVGETLYASGANALSRLPAGPLSYVLTSGGPNTPPSWSAVPGGSGGLTNLGTTTLGSAATAISSGTLDLSSYKAFLAVLRAKNATASTVSVGMTYNADGTVTNYDRQHAVADGTGVAAARANDATIAVLPASSWMDLDVLIKSDIQGKARGRVISEDGTTTALRLRIAAHHYRTATNITGITFTSSVASGFATGTELTVWGLN